MATVEELTQELLTLVKSAPSIGSRGYSVFNVDDLSSIAGTVGFPLAGVSYEGSTQKENSVQPSARLVKGASFVSLRFMLLIGVNYQYASNKDTKPVATGLLDEVRQIVLGYQGVNTRPWRFTGELPLETIIEGVIMYGQLWETDILVSGNYPA